MSAETEITWIPTEDYLGRSRLLAFARKQGVDGYQGLQDWSANEPGAYWDAAVQDLGADAHLVITGA